MDWIQIWTQIITIVVPIGSLFAWFYANIERRFEKMEKQMDERFKAVDERFNKTDQKIEAEAKHLSEKISLLDTRISRIEGVLSVREHWWEHQHYREKEAS